MRGHFSHTFSLEQTCTVGAFAILRVITLPDMPLQKDGFVV